jgi:hypothetical protein
VKISLHEPGESGVREDKKVLSTKGRIELKLDVDAIASILQSESVGARWGMAGLDELTLGQKVSELDPYELAKIRCPTLDVSQTSNCLDLRAVFRIKLALKMAGFSLFRRSACGFTRVPWLGHRNH